LIADTKLYEISYQTTSGIYATIHVSFVQHFSDLLLASIASKYQEKHG